VNEVTDDFMREGGHNAKDGISEIVIWGVCVT